MGLCTDEQLACQLAWQCFSRHWVVGVQELGNNVTVETYNASKDAWVQHSYTTQGGAESQNLRLSFAASCVLDPA